MRKINRAIVHCSATRPEWMDGQPLADKVAEIRRWHVDQNGWADIGYHWIIDRDGMLAPGRPEATQGAHVRGHNADSIGICLLGGFGSNADDAFVDHYTQAQERTLRDLLAEIAARYPGLTIHGHNEFAAKACPGFRAADWIGANARQPRSTPAKSKTMQASTIQAATGAAAVVGAAGKLDGTAQTVAIVGGVVIVLAALFIMRERLKAWAAGWR